MKVDERYLPWCLALLLFPALLSAEEYVFAFHDASTATVYTADTLEFVASPEIGLGAVHAIGVPDPDATLSLLKIFIIRTDAVVVLEPDPPFLQLKTHTLSAPISLGEKSAFLTPDGTKLIVVAGDFLHVFDAIDPADPSEPPRKRARKQAATERSDAAAEVG